MSEFSDLFGEWGVRADGTPRSLTVETFQGEGGWGESYAAAVTLEGLPTFETVRLVRNAQGDEVVSSAQVYAELEHAPKFALESRVTLDGPNPRATKVVQVAAPDAFGLFGFVVVFLE